jgi:uncharacterized coiled-coil protein SlyX
MDLAMLGIGVDSRKVKEAEKDLAGLATQAKKTEGSVSSLEKQSNTSTGKMAAGFSSAAKAVTLLGGALAAAGLSMAFGRILENTIKQEKAVAQLNAALKSTQHAAGLTSKELQTLAGDLQKVTTFGDEATIEMEALLLTFKNIKGDNFKTATLAVLDMAVAMKMDLKSAALMAGKALNDPIAGLSAMGRAGITFSDSQKDLIKNLVKTGEVAEAQRMILTELESQFGGSAKAARDTLGGALEGLSNAFNDLLEGRGNLTGTIAAFEKLTAILSDEKTVAAADKLMTILINGFGKTAESIGFIVDNWESLASSGFFGQVGQWLALSNAVDKYVDSLKDYSGVKIAMPENPLAGASVYADTANEPAKEMSNAISDLIDDLKFEYSQLAKNSTQQKINNELRKAGVSAASIEGQAIASLVTQIEVKTAALKAAEDEDKRIRKAAADAKEAFDKAAEDETTRRFNLFKFQMKEKADALAELDEMLSKPSVESSASLSFGDSYTDEISQAVTAMDRLNSTYEKERELLTENAAIKAAILEQTLAGSDEQEKRLLALTSKENAENEIVFKNQLSGYRELFATTSNLFDEQSKERKKLHQIEQAFAAIEIALNLKKALSAAVTAIATQGSGDPYTAFARVAAMIGLMGSVLAMAGGSLGSGSSSSSSSSAASVGTVSGDSTASSESVTKGYELLQDIHATEYKELRGIHDEMKDLNDNITGLVSNIVRNFGSFDDTMGVWTGEEQNSLAANFEKNYTTGMGIGGFEQTLLPIEKMFSQLTMKAVSWAISGILGGDSKTTMTGSGISLGSTNVGDILNGMSADVQAYADFKTKIDGGWFGSDKTKYNVTYQSVDESITRLFTSLYSNIGKTALEVNESLGASLANEINAYTFDIGKIDLKGKTGDEITEIISTKISEISDTMFESIFGEIVGQYQQINEGVFETAIRLVAEKEVIVAALERSSISITGDVIAITQSISTLAGGIEEFQDIFETYTDAFYTDAEKQAYLQESLSGVFTDLNLILPTTRDGYRAIVESLNMSNESDQERYVTLLQLSEAADEYYTALEDGFDSLVSNIETYVSELTSLSNSVKTALSALFGTTLNVDAARASSKNVLSQAIDAFRTTGTVDNVSEIQTALGVVSSLSADSFSSFEDYQREFFKSVGLISTLGTLTDNQLSIEERMLEAIEEQTDTEETQHTEAMARLDAIRAAVLGETVSVPGFASGGRHAGGWRMVGENGPELEYTGPSQIVENSTSASLLDNRELIEEVKRLRQDLASSQFAIAKNGKDMVKIIYRWDVNGLPEERAV